MKFDKATAFYLIADLVARLDAAITNGQEVDFDLGAGKRQRPNGKLEPDGSSETHIIIRAPTGPPANITGLPNSLRDMEAEGQTVTRQWNEPTGREQ